MAKYYVLKIRGTWLSETEFSINAQGLDSAYCIGPDVERGVAVTRKQYEALRYTRRAKREVDRLGGLSHDAFYFVGLKTKASRLLDRAFTAFLNNEGGDGGFVYIRENCAENVYHAIEAEVVIDVLQEAGF